MNALPSGGGLFASLRGLIATALALLQTRFELLATELEEEKLRLLSALAYGAAAILLLCIGSVFLAIYLTLLWWEQRVLVIGAFTAVFLLCGCGAWLMARRQVRGESRMFAASLAELEQDREALRDNSRESP